MRFYRNVFLAALILLVGPLAVKAAEGDSISLTLDSGFVGRPVELAVFNGDASISWERGALREPTTLAIRQFGQGMTQFVFEQADAVQGSTVTVAIRGAGNAFEITRDGVVDGVIATESANGVLTASVPAAQDLVITPVTSDEVAAQAPSEESVRAASNDTIAPPAPTDETISLMLDLGFVGRPVSLDVFDGELTVAWDEKALIAPTALRLTRTQGGAGIDQEEAAKGVAITFGDPSAVSADGTFTVTHKADRPPEASEQVETNVFGGDAETIQASFVGDKISYAHAAASVIAFAPVFRNGIMRSGIASWYAYKDCLCAASPDVPKGTRMKVSRADNPEIFTVVTINDWGPDRSIHPDRVIDLDKVAFSRIGNPRGGVLDVTVAVLKEDDPLYALGDELPPPPWKW